ncbi:MAG: hypothetical protein WCK65_00185 [Rhodospirillaceae bacterium]
MFASFKRPAILVWRLALVMALLAGLSLWIDEAHADDATSQANRQFISAMQLIRKANATYEPMEERKYLAEADRLLDEIIARFPDTDLAVQLATNQFVGDFDFFEFRNRIKSLVCNEPQTSRCFLFRISALLPPVETPINTARWDWMSLAVAHHILGDTGRSKEIIAPFLSAVRRGVTNETSERDLFVARALGLTGQTGLALEIARKIPDCATRIYDLADIAGVLLGQGEREQAAALTEEARAYAEAKSCTAEQGLVARALIDVGRVEDARTLFKSATQNIATGSTQAKGDCCTPELAIAAAEFGDASLTFKLLRMVQEENPWVIAPVLGRLARRGEDGTIILYTEQIADIDNRSEVYAELIESYLKRDNRSAATDLMNRLIKMANEDGGRRPLVIAQRARAEKALAGGNLWRATFQQALTAAERVSGLIRRDIGGPLVAVLVKIETGRPLLD